MTFDSIEAFKSYILKQSEVAIKNAQDKVGNIINHFLTEYYKEYDPEVYVRTYQLLKSLVKSDVKRVGDSWVAEVYFDLDALNYATRIVPQGQSWSAWASPESTFHRNDWTHENDKWVLETAMTGGNTGRPHGGYASGTQVWNESLKILNVEAINILKEKLIQAGVPVK